MKQLLYTSILFSLVVLANGQAPPPITMNSCECDDDHFMYLNGGQRLCLSETDLSGQFPVIPGCAKHTYDTSNGLKCAECQSTHVLVVFDTVCIEHEIDGCIEATVASSQRYAGQEYVDFQFTCQKCGNGKQIDDSDDSCANDPSPIIPNCLEHKLVSSVQNCVKCDNSTYLNHATHATSCTAFSISHCLEYEKQSEQAYTCTQCNATSTNTILYSDGSQCFADDSSVSNCDDLQYNQANTTLFCKEGGCSTGYATDTSDLTNCEQILTNSITGCDDNKHRYDGSSAWTCSECQTGYVPTSDDTACNQPSPTETAKNCATFVDSTNWNCATCPSSHPVKKHDNSECLAAPTTEAEATAARWTQNCDTWISEAAEFKCDVCDSGYFLHIVIADRPAPKCFQVESVIQHCKVYTNDYQCSLCEDGYKIEHRLCHKCPDTSYTPPTPPQAPNCPVQPTNTTNPTNNTIPQNPSNPTNNTGLNSTNTTNSQGITIKVAFIGFISLLVLLL